MHNLDGWHSYVGILAFLFFQTLLLWMLYLTFWFGLLDNMGSENQKSQSMIALYMVFFYMRLFPPFFFKAISSLNLKLIVRVDLASILQKWLTEFNQGALFSLTIMSKTEVSICIIRQTKSDPLLYSPLPSSSLSSEFSLCSPYNFVFSLCICRLVMSFSQLQFQQCIERLISSCYPISL